MHLFPTSTMPSDYVLHFGRFYFHLTRHLFRILVVTTIATSLSFLVINIVLLLLQINGLPLFAKVGDVDVSLKTPAQATQLLENYSHAQSLNLLVQGKAYKSPAEANGIKLNTAAIISSIQHPSGLNRIPFFNAINNYKNDVSTERMVDQSKLKAYLSKIELPKTMPAVDASIVIPSDQAKQAYITPEKDGYAYSIDKIVNQVASVASVNKNLVISVDADTLQPKVKAAQLNAGLTKTNSMLANSFTITNNSTTYTLTAADLRKIVSLDGTNAVISQPQLIEILRAHSNAFYKAPEAKKVSTLDGNIVATLGGSDGQTINITESAKLVAKALEDGKTSQAVSMSSVAATTTYLRNYSATSEGLAALMKDFAGTHSGKYAAVTIELSSNRSAAFNSTVPTVPASTYKVFLAYIALRKVEQGVYSLSTPTSAGTLDHCLHQMILISDNTCAGAIHDLLGWANVDAIIHADGFTSTFLNNSGGGYMSATAADEAAMLRALYNGSLINASSTDYLLNLMKNQIYRSGIPAGSPNSVVADKVGFLEGWNHDAAIVYAPKSTYVLVVFTTGASFAQIKDLANQIYNIYNQ